MRRLKTLLTLFVAICLVAISALLLADNATPVSLKVLNYETPSVPVFWWLLAALILGFLGGATQCIVGHFRRNAVERKPRRELNRNQGSH